MSSTVLSTTMPQQKKTLVAPQRVASVDVLRGITIAFMILVNDPGDWDHLFSQLDHAPWNGWTLTDLVFPTFLFLMGASMVFSFATRVARGDCRKSLTGHLFLRTGKILLLQFLIVFFPRMNWVRLRLFGVLTRIALCYLLAGLVLLAVMKMRRRVAVLVGVVAVLLVGYWVLLRWVPVPGLGMPVRDFPLLDMEKNLTSWIDRGAMAWTQHWLHTGTLYKKVRDPEGLLSTLPAVASVLLGSLTGMWMRSEGSTRRMRWVLAAAGVVGVCSGTLWGVWFPINKNLWTSSYVLLAAGWAMLALALVSSVVDGREQPWPRWLKVATWPWLVYGSNAIVAFTASAVFVKGMLYFKLTDADGYRHSAWEWVYEHWFVRAESTKWTSLEFALAFVVVCFLPNWWLWRRKWFLKV